MRRTTVLCSLGSLSSLCSLVVTLASCGPDSLPPAPPEPEPPLRAGCNPLGGADNEDCLLPYPSSFFTTPDATTATGVRVNLPSALLPANPDGVHVDTTTQNRQDGYSASTTLLAYFPGDTVDDSSLPGPDHVEASLDAGSTVQLVRFDTGERVPLFAELDANVKHGQRQALMIRPVVRLAPKTRYVAVVQHLKSTSGREIAPLSGFRALRDDLTIVGSPRYAERAHFEEMFTSLEHAGINRTTLQLAWDFTTASDEPITGRLVRMRDQSTSYHEAVDPPPTTFITVDESPADLPNLRRRIIGTFTVPSFLTDDETGGLNLGDDGEPKIRGFGQFPLAIHIPACAETATLPLPVMIYGHGSYSTAETEMSSDYQREIINRLCMVQIGTDWIGRALDDSFFFLTDVLDDVSKINVPTGRLQQAHVNVLALARLIKSGALVSLPELMLNGAPLIDPSRVYYYGISEGGIQGGTFLALTPDIDRGALNVPCGFWSSFFWRSSDFHVILPVFQESYPDPIDMQVLMALTQPLWDYTDPATYAVHLLSDPLPGSSAKKVLYQEGIDDASVPNLNTRAMVRTMKMPLLRPRVEPVVGVDEAEGPLESGYAQFDIGATPRLGDNDVPPAVTPTHETIRRLEPVKEQLQLFLREGGKVQETCGGQPCVGLKE